ncbi:hypothetical protein [Paraglaciecola marina]|uniref:hypothetical protein n=1 Tax=Paraglaciecola marina TaxID=2500157 RepID=UPI00105F8203|nr:hypothetical protein [Paraglaciecola marina]
MSKDLQNMRFNLQMALDTLDASPLVSKAKDTVLVDPRKLNIRDADSLIARCENVVRSGELNNKPTLRLIHHFACSGGTLISKCLAALPNVFLLSEVHPETTNHLGGGKPKFLPTDITSLSRYAGVPKVNELAIKIFTQNIRCTYQHVVELGGLLILRDHSHSDYCVGPRFDGDSKVYSVLKTEFDILRLVTIRHPVDAYMSLVKNNWEQHEPKGFEEYCKRFLIFTSHYPKSQIVKYEDVVKDPNKSIKVIANKLNLPFTSNFIDIFDTMLVTGDSGRSGAVIEERPRRTLTSGQIKMVQASKSFKKIAKKFDYRIPEEVE